MSKPFTQFGSVECGVWRESDFKLLSYSLANSAKVNQSTSSKNTLTQPYHSPLSYLLSPRLKGAAL